MRKKYSPRQRKIEKAHVRRISEKFVTYEGYSVNWFATGTATPSPQIKCSRQVVHEEGSMTDSAGLSEYGED